MRKRTGLNIAVFMLSLLVAAGCAFMLLDVWGWLQEENIAASELVVFPGVEEPPMTLPAEPVSDEPFNVLILGLDHGLDRPVQGYERSDVIIIAHIDEAAGKAVLLSLPRDSYVSIPGYRKSKINEAYQAGGVDLAVHTVEQVTGMRIRNYVVVDFDEFMWLVDLFGGVPVTMEEPLNDPKVGYIGAGGQQLDGEHALMLARSRDYPQGDLERVRQQQRIIIQALYKGKEMASYPGAAWFLSIALDPLETNLTQDEVIALARGFAELPVVDVQGGVAPGKPGMVGAASVYILDETALRELVRNIEQLCFVPEEFR
ncbi:MAG: LCP family protein [Actinomycetota bacterium]|nr:LCP family protein [Actinomycetota bacterium]